GGACRFLHSRTTRDACGPHRSTAVRIDCRGARREEKLRRSPREMLLENTGRRYNRVVLAFQIAKGKLKPAEKRLPKLRPGWALVRVRLAGICNTDVEILRGYHNFCGTPGHEFVGEVVDVRRVSAATKSKWLGRRVCGEINVSCPAYGFKPVCNFCKRGLKTHCE